MTDFALIIDYIKDNAYKPLNCPQVAKQFGIGREHFSRYFSKHTGETFVNFRNRLRIDKAKQLLSAPSTVKEIASQVGFESVVQFHRAFLKFAGTTPMQYRKQIHLQKSGKT